MKDHMPYIPADKKLPELTLKAVLLGMLLSVILSAANAYFGLFAGMTVSASIPAAVISMVVLRFFRRSNILENNMVQTAASAGESLAAGVIFTMPALVLLGYWQEFNYIETTLIAAVGGVLGVLFTIPLRQALIVREGLKFPEGVATAEVLKTGEGSGGTIKYLVVGGIIGLAFKLADSGLKLWHNIFEGATIIKSKYLAYFGVNLSPALIGVGYIVGLNVSLLIFLGGCISWYIAIPAYLATTGMDPAADPVALGYSTWNSQIRFLGVGAMVVGGLWALVSIRNSIGTAVKSGLAAFKAKGPQVQLRTEQDTPMNRVMILIIVLIFPVFGVYYHALDNALIAALMAVIMVLGGFLFSSVAGYMAGLVGSSNNPISGVTIATVLFTALLLFALLGDTDVSKGAAASIMVGAIVACAAAIAGDNMQDLKAGYILGATPWRMQVMQIVGVLAGALTMAPVLNILLNSYGFGPKTLANPDSLAAPQATLMQSVAEGIFAQNLPWTMVFLGMSIGVVVIIADQVLKARGSSFRMPVLAVAVGLYLPLELDSSVFIGGLIAYLTTRSMKPSVNLPGFAKAKAAAGQTGLLLASGLITGEALMGIFFAVIVTVWGGDVLALGDGSSSWPGLVLLLGVLALIYFSVKARFQKELKA